MFLDAVVAKADDFSLFPAAFISRKTFFVISVHIFDIIFIVVSSIDPSFSIFNSALGVLIVLLVNAEVDSAVGLLFLLCFAQKFVTLEGEVLFFFFAFLDGC